MCMGVQGKLSWLTIYNGSSLELRSRARFFYNSPKSQLCAGVFVPGPPVGNALTMGS